MENLSSYFEIIETFNPVYFTMIAAVLVIFVVHIIYFNVVIPQRTSHLKKEHELSQENLRLKALFGELDPDPVLRLNIEGIITHSNIAAKTLLIPPVLIGSNIKEIFPESLEVKDAIQTNSSKTLTACINEREYSVLLRGIKEMQFAQIYFHDITERKNYERELKDFSILQQQSIEAERKRIAKELHDGIGQNLSAARLIASRLTSRKLEEEVLSEIMDVKEIISSSINELKEISYNLKPRILDEIGLESALISLCNNFSNNSGINGIFKFEKLETKLSTHQEICLYRIAQEALTNIQRHSSAEEFSMQLINRNNKIRLVITDNGKGFSIEELNLRKGVKKGLGLLSMRERAESFRGKFEIESSRNEGTMITVEIPVEAN